MLYKVAWISLGSLHGGSGYVWKFWPNAILTAIILIIINIFHLFFATIVVIVITFLWEMNAGLAEE